MRIISVRPGDIALYTDPNSPRPVFEPGYNQWAMIVDENGGLARRRRKIVRVPFEELLAMPNIQFRRCPYEGHRELIANYFLNCTSSPELFDAGEKSLLLGNLQPFEWGMLFPNPPSYESKNEFEEAWNSLLEQARPLDAIFTIRRDSMLSRFIAWATHGPFSHTATYLGDDKIWESVTSGLRKGSLSQLYKNTSNWVAAYRRIELIDRSISSEAALKGAMEAEAQYRDGYNYYQAMRHGWMAFRGHHDIAKVPNSFIYRGCWVLIAHA